MAAIGFRTFSAIICSGRTWRPVVGQQYNSTTAGEDTRQASGSADENIEDHKKDALFRAALNFVPKHGWSRKALIAGAESVGMPGISHGLFPRGGSDLVIHFYASCNAELSDTLEVKRDAILQQGEVLKVSEFIRDALEVRLRMLTPYIDTWPQAMAILAIPTNTPLALQHLRELVDDIWHFAGDRSVDMNWYTKRASLAALYKSTELCMITDKSEDFQETWLFLDRRMASLASFGRCVRQCQESTSMLGTNAFGAYHVARNILGINARQR